MNGLVKLRDLKKGEKFYGKFDEMIHVMVECIYDETKPDDIAYITRLLKAKDVNKYAIHTINAIDIEVYRYTGRDRSSFLAGFRSAIKICIPHMGKVEMENAGINDLLSQHMTMINAYKKWTKNFDDYEC
ncbi:MAG: hypothetical protein WC428_02555 [Candidatus Paceibacterota bacterium]|jgi:hypothetical protein